MLINSKFSNKIISIVLSLMLMLSLVPVNAFAASENEEQEQQKVLWADVALEAKENTDYTTDGTNYTVKTAKGLAYIANIVNNGNSLEGAIVKLENDIDLTTAGVTDYDISTVNSDNSWTPIGINSSKSFSGTFDGENHTISGMYINKISAYNSGLFGIIKNASIKNLNVEGTITANTYIGSIAGKSENSNINNCSSNVTEKGRFYIGGIVGSNSGTVSQCCNTKLIKGAFGIGGILGYNTGIVTDCYNTGVVDSGNYSGGITGFNSNIVKNCYNIGSINSSNVKGGIIGYDENGTVTNTYFLKTESINSTVEGIGYDETYIHNSSVAKNEAEFNSGEVAYLLQGDEETPIWGQSLVSTVDNYPKFTNKPEEKVLKVIFINDNAEYAFSYTNQGSKISEPVEPEKTGNTFEGWYKEESLENKWDFDSDTLTQDTNLYSKWEIRTYLVTYTLENMTAENQPDYVTFNTEAEILLKPDDGYKLPETVTVKRDGEELIADSDYTISKSADGLKIFLPAQTVSGDLEIIAAGIPLSNNTDLTGLSYEFDETKIDLTPEQLAEAGTDDGVTIVLHHGTQDGTEISLFPETANDKDSVLTQGAALIDGSCTCTVTVTAEDRKTQKIYKLNFIVNEEHTPGQIVIENTKSATCTEEGSYDEVIYCTICKNEVTRAKITTDPLGHKWSEWELTKAPTATEKGEETRTCQVCNENETREVEPDSTAPVISGIEDGSFYNEEKTVTVKDALLDTVTVNGKSVELDENNSFKLDTTDGVYIIVATDKAGNSTTKTVTMDTTVPAIKSSSSLKEGGVYCLHLTGTFDEKNIDRILVNDTEMQIANANTEHPGFTMISSSANKPIYGNLTIEVIDKAGNTLTVHVTLNEEHTYVEYERVELSCTVRGHIRSRCSVCTIATKYEDLGYGDHSYGDPVFEWSEDGKTATATFTCKNDQSHKEQVEATVTEIVKKQATCTEEGITTYTATVTFNDKEYSDTKDVTDIPKTEHTPEIVNDKEATCTEDGYTGDTVCSVCGEVLKVGEIIPAKGHDFENGKCTGCGVLLGDVDLDGKLTVKDATLVQLHCAGLTILTENQLSVANVDQDKEINVKDATIIQLYLAGLITELK